MTPHLYSSRYTYHWINPESHLLPKTFDKVTIFMKHEWLPNSWAERLSQKVTNQHLAVKMGYHILAMTIGYLKTSDGMICRHCAWQNADE